MMRRVTMVGTAILASLFSGDVRSTPGHHDPIVPSVNRCSDQCLRKHVDLTAKPDAVKLIEQLRKDPGNAAVRIALAEEYSDAGHVAAAAFYRATADQLCGRMPKGTSDTRYEWVFTAEASRASDRAANEIARLIDEGKYEEAVNVASHEVEQYPSESVVLEWCEAVRIASEAHVRMSVGEQETAIRWLLTLPEEAGATSWTSGSLPEVYLALSDYFLAVGDRPSAYVAAQIGLERLSRSDTADYLRVGRAADAVRGRLQHRIDVLDRTGIR